MNIVKELIGLIIMLAITMGGVHFAWALGAKGADMFALCSMFVCIGFIAHLIIVKER